jgi:hypothetical protein
MNSEIHRASKKKQNASPNDFTSLVALRAKIERYHAVLSRLLEEPNEGQDADENRLAEIFLELQIRAKCGELCEISRAGRARVRSFTAVLKRQDMPSGQDTKNIVAESRVQEI